jgi:hypothetical protein
MNERIKQLAIEAKLIASEPNGFDQNNLSKAQQKFAQLIVLECVNAVMDGNKEGDHYAQRIEQHFDNGHGGVLHFGVE